VRGDAGRVLQKMKRGSFFGEIGLLKNEKPGADVVALEDSVCLTIEKDHFLNLIGQDYFIEMQFEVISKGRLS
jgi:CRP-like cAMP-binding protein